MKNKLGNWLAICFTTLVFSACDPWVIGDSLESLAPPSFSWSESRVRFSDNTGRPALFELRIALNEYNELYELVKLEVDIAMTDNSSTRLYDYNENRERHYLIDPILGWAADYPRPSYFEDGQGYYEVYFSPYNNEFLESEVAVYRWIATLKLKEGGTDELQIESGIYLATDNAFDERPPAVNYETGERTPPLNTSYWIPDSGIFSPTSPKPKISESRP